MTTETILATAPSTAQQQAPVSTDCDECAGSGGWFRYEPALDPAPGQLYLSCVECRGSGRLAALRG
jgi:DnaJ-class molecular chaperone